MKQIPNVFKRILITTMLVLTLSLTAASSYTSVSSVSNSDSVLVAESDLDSLFAGVDSLLLERRLLQIKLREVQQHAYIDSVVFTERLALRDLERDNWFVRMLKHPAMDAVYFVFGVYVGANAVAQVR